MAIFGQDNFTDTDAVALESHTSPLDATTWTEHGSYTGGLTDIRGNRARTGTVPSLLYNSGSPATAEYTVEVDFYVATVAASVRAVAGRIDTAADTFYFAQIDMAGTGAWTVKLFKKVVGSNTQLSSAYTGPGNLTAGTTVNIKLELLDSAKKVYVDGVEQISSADNAITAAGKAGIFGITNNSATTPSRIVFDNFEAADASSAATHLVFDEQPTDAPYDIVIDPPVTVFALNDAEEVDLDYIDDVTIAIATNPGTGVLSGTLTQAAVDGVATFDDLTIDEVGAGYTLEATAAGLTGTPESTAFDILDQVATYLEFVVQPSNAEEDVVISPDITVEANQPDTTRDTDYVGDITLAIGTNPSGGILSGTVTKTAVAGLATFNDLDIDEPGTGYTLIATATGLTQDESATFNITQEAAVELDFLVEPVDTQVNTIIDPPIRVRALDSEGDVDTNYVANVVLSKFSGPGIISGTLTKAAVAGVAEFDDIQGDTAGAYVLRATSGALPTEDSVAFALSDTPPSEQDLGADVLMGGWPGRMRLG